MSKSIIIFPMWLAYLLADAVPIYAVGLISRKMSSSSTSSSSLDRLAHHLVVFWAPFLLLHLGGPDTITAFSIEDNELWKRHFLNLLVQCAVVLYALYLSFPGNALWLPTVLIFVAGIIKYAERTCSLYLASLRGFANSLLGKPDPGPDYDRLMDEYDSKIKAGIPAIIHMGNDRLKPTRVEHKHIRNPLDDLEVIWRAYLNFEAFKGLIADRTMSSSRRTLTREYFLHTGARDALRMVEVELNFFYEILYTKGFVVQGMYGFLLRISSFGLNCAALVLFKLMDKHKQGYKEFDVGLTYTLLGSAISLDALSFLMVLSSDRAAVVFSNIWVRHHGNGIYDMLIRTVKRIMSKLFRVDRKRWPGENMEYDTGTNQIKAKTHTCTFNLRCIMHTIRRRWSESIPQYNLLDYCLRPRPNIVECAIGFCGLTNILDSCRYVGSKDFGHGLRDFIYSELIMKSRMAEELDTASREVSSARGDWILRYESCMNLLPWVDRVDFDESILLWHIATELLYNTDNVTTSSNTDNNGNPTERDFREWSKILSDYMLYLLIMQTTMLSSVAGIGQDRYRDTCAEARRFFSQREIRQVDNKMTNCCLTVFCCSECLLPNNLVAARREKENKVLLEACERILAVNTHVKPVSIKGTRSKSVLFDACMLAKELKKLGEDQNNKSGDKGGDSEVDIEEEEEEEKRVDKWRIICAVWVEMMSYAASHCKGTSHAAELSKGGQLLTLVWLLMAHLGLGDHFQKSEIQPPAKLIIEK